MSFLLPSIDHICLRNIASILLSSIQDLNPGIGPQFYRVWGGAVAELRPLSHQSWVLVNLSRKTLLYDWIVLAQASSSKKFISNNSMKDKASTFLEIYLCKNKLIMIGAA